VSTRTPLAHAVRVGEWCWLTIVLVGLATFGAAWFAGWQLRSVDTGSMAPAIPTGSLAVVVSVSPADVEVGDVIAFADPLDRSITVMHRVIAMQPSKEGRTYLQTQGDANRTPDPLLVPADTVEGRVVRHIPRLGTVAQAARSPFGLGLLVVTPLVLGAISALLDRRSQRSVGSDRDEDIGDHVDDADDVRTWAVESVIESRPSGGYVCSDGTRLVPTTGASS
jgi:signal peptidase